MPEIDENDADYQPRTKKKDNGGKTFVLITIYALASAGIAAALPADTPMLIGLLLGIGLLGMVLYLGGAFD